MMKKKRLTIIGDNQERITIKKFKCIKNVKCNLLNYITLKINTNTRVFFNNSK